MTLNVAQEDHVDAGARQGHAGWHRRPAAHPAGRGATHRDGPDPGARGHARRRHPGGDRVRVAGHGPALLRRHRGHPRREPDRGADVHVHAAVRDRAARPRGAVRVPRPAGAATTMARRGLLRELLRSGPGRLGLVLAWRCAPRSWRSSSCSRYPLDFGPARWSNPQVWADYPKAAPPAWTTLLGGDRAVQHRVLEATEPTEVAPGRARPRSAPTRCPSATREDEPPTFLSFAHGTGELPRPPAVVRGGAWCGPMATRSTLYRDVVRGPRPGEAAALRAQRGRPRCGCSWAPSRQRARRRSSKMLARGVRRDGRRRRARPGIRRRRCSGCPDGTGGFTPLHGDYRIEVRVAVADPTDTIAEVGAVVGGSVYGIAGHRRPGPRPRRGAAVRAAGGAAHRPLGGAS